MTHQSGEEGEQVRFRSNEAVADQVRFDRVKLTANQLGVAGQTFKISERASREITLLEPNERVVSAIMGAISSHEALLLSAAPGSGAAFTARWLLSAIGAPHAFERLARSTSLESLVGALRPEEDKQLRVKDGPLARCIRDGGVMIIDGIERADPQVKAALKALAAGQRTFHHPVTGELIKVNDDFRLVLIGDQRERQLAKGFGIKTVREIRAYDETEHRRLAIEQLGMPGELASTLAQYQTKLTEKVAGSDLDFGRGFPLGWELLERAGKRLAKTQRRDPGDVGRTLLGVYGARLDRSQQRESFEQLLQEMKLWPPSEPRFAKSKDPTYVHTPRIDRALAFAEEALAAGEMVNLRAHGQSGATRLVDELARRRNQEVVTVLGHSGLDAQALVDTPTFDEKGQLYFKPGRITHALLEGKILYVDHLDHLPREQQNAIFQLRRQTTVRVLEGDKIVERPVHKNARLVISTTVGNVRGRTPPEPRDRAGATEIYLEPAALDELPDFLSPAIKARPEFAEQIMATVRALDDEQSAGDLRRLQRFLDFSNTAQLLTQHGFSEDAAIARAARMVYAPKKSEVLKKLERGAVAAANAPLWQRVLELKPRDVEKALAATGYRITESMNAHLDALAIALRLGRPVRAVGPASSGKTVLGSIFAALLQKSPERVNFSQATEGRDLLGGMAPVNENGRTMFRHVEGPAMVAAELHSVLVADEWNLSRQGQMALKSALDYRAKLIDPENDLERSFTQSFFYAAQNANDSALGRFEPPPEVADCMFTIAMNSRPVEEKVEVVLSQSTLARQFVEPLADLFGDVEMLVAQGKLVSSVAPITSTERDILKAARTATHLIQRDGVKGGEDQRRLVGREVYRLIRDQLSDPAERELMLELVQRHFGKDVVPPPRPTGIERITVKVDGKNVEMLQIGSARFPVRLLDDPKLQELVPKLDGLRTPVGVQYEFLESVLLGAELGEPVAVLGNTGTGKTMLMKWLAHQLNQPVLEQPFHADMTEEHLFGSQVVKKDGTVEFQYGDLPYCIKKGIWYLGDEPTTLGHSVREALNPVTERSEIQIAQKRPPERILAKDWDPDFRYFETTNGDDIRQDGYSPPEASRRRIIALPELETAEEYLEVGARDYKVAAEEIEVLKRNPENRARIGAEISGWFDKRTKFGKQFSQALDQAIGNGAPEGLAIDPADVPALELTPAQIATLLQAYDVFTFEKKDAALLAMIDELLASSTGDAFVQAAAHLEPLNRSVRLQERLLATAAVGHRLVDGEEVEAATNLFFEMRQLQKQSKDAGPTPLTPRIYSTFMEVLAELRTRRSFPAAAMRAAELILSPALSEPLQKKLTDLVLEHAGKDLGPQPRAEAPETLERSVRFGDLLVPFGSQRAWNPSNERFPLTEPRCRNLQAIAESMELGRGRPISVTDDENGEALETLREYGGLTGRPVTVVTLPPNVELEQLLEKLVVAKGKVGGFEPELQQIAQAIQQGHILVLRGCGNVSSTRLERLNSLGDGRQAIRLPVSGEWLKAPPDFRMVLMRTPDSLEHYSAALQNRLITPPLTTQQSPNTEEAREARAGELAAVLRERCSITDEASDKLGVFHVYLNHMIREGRFASGRAVGTFLNRDAESVARRLAWLLERHEVDDENEALLSLVMEVYGERFSTPIDRERLLKLAQDAFQTESTGLTLGAEITPGPLANRVGPWAISRDERGTRDRLPTPESVLPAGSIFDRVLEKVGAAAHWDEVIHLTGNDFIGEAAVATLARLTTSPIISIEGNRELTEAYLFGGVVQNQKTGEFEEHEGMVFKAQREGGTLVVKNASSLAPEVLTRLTEIAATGHVQRVKDGKLDAPLRSFRLVLRTSEGDPPLPKELGGLCTVIRAPEITGVVDLRTMAEHQLRRLPGAKVLAKALVDFHVFAAKQIEDESQLGRQELKFDSACLVEATRDIAERVNRDGWSLESAIADAITRLYMRPSEGLELEGDLRVRFEKLVGSLDGWLEQVQIAPIDLVETPEVEALKNDYGKVAMLFSGELFRAAADALDVAVDRRKGRPAQSALAALVDSNLLPKKLADRGRKLLETIPWGKLDEDAAKQVASFSRALVKEAAQEQPFQESVHAFVRGARVWDLDYRLEILRRYEGMFSTLAELGGGIAAARQRDLDSVRERFDAAEAKQRLEVARNAVRAAAGAYEQRAGKVDPQATILFRRVMSTWDLVSTSPIFRAHALPELHELERALIGLEEAYERRGEPMIELSELSEAVRHASKTLEGIRIAEQSADLRRGIQRSNRSTEQLVTSLKDEVAVLRNLESARKQHDHLSKVEAVLVRAAEEGVFLRLDPASEKIDRPPKRSDDELRAEAKRTAEREVAKVAADQERQLLEQVNALAAKTKAPLETFFDRYSLELDPEPAPVAATPVERAWSDGLAKIEAASDRAVEERTKELVVQLRAADDKRVEEIFQTRLKQRVQEVGAKIQFSANTLRSEIAEVVRAIELPPELATEAAQTIALLDEAVANTRGWMAKTAKVAEKVVVGFARAMITIGTLGLMDLPEEEQEKQGPSIDDAKRAAAALLQKLHRHVLAEKQGLPDFGVVPEHAKRAESLVDQLLSAERLGELATKYTRLEALRNAEQDPEVKRHLTMVSGQIRQERGMKEMLEQVSAFCEGADLLSAEAAKGGVPVELAPAVDQVMRAAEAVRTQPLAAGAYKRTVSALARAIEQIDELAEGGLRMTDGLGLVREEMQALSDRIHELFAGRRDLLTIEGGNYREMLRSLSSAEGPSASESVEAAFEPIARLRELEAEPEPNVEILSDALDEIARAHHDAETEGRPERAARLTVIEVSFDRARELEVPAVAPKKKETEEDLAAREAQHALKTQVLARTAALEDRAAERSSELSREKDRLLEILDRLESRSSTDALVAWSETIEELRAGLESLAASPDGVRGFVRELRMSLDAMRKAATGLRGLEQIPDAAVAKLESAIEGARALESSFSSDRFLHLARDWAAGAMLAVTETAGILNELSAAAKQPEGGESSLKLLGDHLDKLCAPPGRLGAWSRLSMLLHTEQRLEALARGREGDEAAQIEKLLVRIREAKAELSRIAGGPESENAAADILEASVELGAALIASKDLEEEQANDFAALAEKIDAILSPGNEHSEADRTAISTGIETAEKLAKLSGDAGERAREVSLALGHLRGDENARHLASLRGRVRDEASTYLGRVRDARLLLDEAMLAFVDYDPLTAKAPLQEVARELRAALTDANDALIGPASVVLAKTLLDLADRLEDVIEAGGPAAAEANRLHEELDPLLRRARVVGEAEDAPARFVAMVQAFESRTDKNQLASDEAAAWAGRASAALSSLMTADDAVVAQQLAAVEAEHFPELAEKERAAVVEAEERAVVERAAEAERAAVPVQVSRVAQMLSSGGSQAGARLRELRSHDRAPNQPDGTRIEGEVPELEPQQVDAPKADQKLGPINRGPLEEGTVTSRSDRAGIVASSSDGLKDIRKRMQNTQLEVEEKKDLKAELLSDFDQFVKDNEKLVEEMAATLRQFPGLETVLVIDQSGSTNDRFGDSRIIDQERAAMALILAAHMRAERNCAVIGFGDAVGEEDRLLSTVGSHRHPVHVFAHKKMAERLTPATADYAFQMAKHCDGWTDFIEPGNQAMGQFTDRANNKLILFLTDAALNGTAELQKWIADVRDQHVGFAMLGFGDAEHVRQVAQGFGEHVSSYAEAITKTKELFLRTVVQNANRFKGQVKGAADGIGTPQGQSPLSAAPSDGPMDQALLLSEPTNIQGDPAEVFGSSGKKRELANLVEKGRYERAVKELDRRHVEISRTASYKRCLKEVRMLRARHEREGTIEALCGAIQPTLPKTRGVEWERKQLSGSSFDEQQLMLYVAGLAQGVPVQRIFKRRKGSEETKATVVLMLDESSSMGDSEKMRANLEALLAYGDALKAADPEIKIAVVGYGDKVRLHSGFEQDWNDELKAHLLHQTKGTYDATDDERGAAEAIGLLRMMDAEVGMVLNFSDGQGMPGMEAVMKSANEDGYAFLTCGVGADCVAVSRFGHYGLYARNLAQLTQKISPRLFKSWELAGRLT